MTENAKRLLATRYCWPGEKPEDVYKRVAEAVCIGDFTLRDWFQKAMEDEVFLPNSPCLRNAGKKNGLLHACFVLPIEDNIEGIFKTLQNTSTIFHYGGGVGVNFSNLRPAGSVLSTGGSSSGAVSFMGIFDKVTDTVKQGGFRRGALMGLLDYDHPEITQFIRAKLKGDLLNFNLSVMVNDWFMEAMTSGTKKMELRHGGNVAGKLKAKDVFDLMCFTNWCCGDPGILFFDRINKDNKYYPKLVLKSCNPCSEALLPEYGACTLGSINLSKFVKKDGGFKFEEFEKTVRMATRVLLNTNRVGWYPLPEIYATMREYDPIGLGVMGFADCLIKMGVRYDNDGALQFIRELGSIFTRGTSEIAKNSFYQRIIAPTGSLSILADCSSGIEPIFGRYVTRSLDADIGVIEERRDIYSSEYAVCAHEISPEWHLKVQAEWQKVVDGGISKTINVPNSTSVDDIKEIYKKAWELGCKSVTVFRDGCKEGVLRQVGKCDGDTCYL